MSAQRFQILLQDIGGAVYVIDVADEMTIFKATTIHELKKKVKTQAKPEYALEDMRLLFAGKQLEETKTLAEYKIKKNSVIFLVQRMPGGSTRKTISLPPKDNYDKRHDLNDSSVVLTNAQDCLDPFPPDKDAPPRVKMSCGHAFDPSNLTAYCRNLVEKGEFNLYCPANTDKAKQKQCRKIWDYSEVRQAALLNDAECQWFESKMSESAALALQYCDMKQCPGCNSYAERADCTNLRVHCPTCTKINGRVYEFCWQCLQEWTGPSTSTGCGRKECVPPELATIQDAPMMKLHGVYVPNRRACPNCGKVVEHNGTGCKMMACVRCNKEFCFFCLEFKENCLKSAPGSHFRACQIPVAPKQTCIPVWRH